VPAYSSSVPRARRSSFIALVVATAVLYLASEVLIPLAIAILLAFLAAPAVRRLERWKLPRLAATLLVAALGFGLIFGIGAIAATQAVSLAAKLPEYRHNIAPMPKMSGVPAGIATPFHTTSSRLRRGSIGTGGLQRTPSSAAAAHSPSGSATTRAS